MIIKDSGHPKSFLKAGIEGLKANKKVFKFFCFILYTVLIFFIGVVYHFSTLPQDKKTLTIDTELIQNNQKYNPKISKPETIEIGISEGDFLKILAKRNEAVKSGVLVTSSDDYVPAKIRHNDKKLKAKLRLKGDWVDHLKGTKWSFRISIKNKETLFGMREFSIQHPKERNFISEWVYHQAMKREDVIGLDFRYVNVIINDKDFGIYALEEHFDKRLIENNKYREGPILKFDEDLLWADRNRGFEEVDHPSGFFSSAIDVFQSKKVKQDKKLNQMYQKGYNLLERFRNQTLKTSDVFDVQLMAKYYALTDILGGQHMAVYHNMRFYYNPVTSKLEPIAFDAMAGTPIEQLLGVRAFNTENTYYAFDRNLFSDAEFMKAYMIHLNRMAQPTYLQTLLGELNSDMEKNINILNIEFSNLPIHNFFNQLMTQNFKYINMALNPIKTVHAYYKDFDGDVLTLRIANVQPLPVRINEIEKNGLGIFRPIEESIVDGKIISKPVVYKDIKFRAVGDITFNDRIISQLKLNTNVLGNDTKMNVDIVSDYKYDEKFITNDFIRQRENYNEFSFIEVNSKAKKMFLKKGSWKISKNLIFPDGYKIIASPGFRIDLKNDAKILSYSPFIFLGSKDNPITIESSDGTGQGIVLMKTKERSNLVNVIFKNLSAPSQNGWELTGAVTFYESPVSILRCKFLNNRDSDDYLNIVRSDFDIKNSQFSQTFADAIDIDFSKGFINGLDFNKTGNDALDFSGSIVSVRNVKINEAKDKGLSVGEQSHVVATNITIENSKMGFVSKDSSKLEVSKSKLSNCYIGLIAYQKKSEFGPAEIIANKITRENVKKPFITQGASRITLNGKIIQSNESL